MLQADEAKVEGCMRGEMQIWRTEYPGDDV